RHHEQRTRSKPTETDRRWATRRTTRSRERAPRGRKTRWWSAGRRSARWRPTRRWPAGWWSTRSRPPGQRPIERTIRTASFDQQSGGSSLTPLLLFSGRGPLLSNYYVPSLRYQAQPFYGALPPAYQKA